MRLGPKHAIKLIDHLLSNSHVTVWQWFDQWIKFVVAARPESLVALNWTEFDKDDHATIALYLVTSHGRATPLAWKTARKYELKIGEMNTNINSFDACMRFSRKKIPSPF